MKSQPIHEVSASKYPIQGLGDLVWIAAHPIATVLDATLGTDFENCGGCAGRRERWNQAVPFKNDVDGPGASG